MYKSIDFTIDKITRRMRKCKTRLLKRRNPGQEESIHYLDERNQNLSSSTRNLSAYANSSRKRQL
jgi:hypothetical protein